MNLTDEIQRERLFKAVENSYRALDPFRTMNRNLVASYAGSGYGARRPSYAPTSMIDDPVPGMQQPRSAAHCEPPRSRDIRLVWLAIQNAVELEDRVTAQNDAIDGLPVDERPDDGLGLRAS